MLSTVQETSAVVSIVGRCSVLDYQEYSTVRPTEITESDVFVCESVYDEQRKQIRRTQQGSGLRKFTHSQLVVGDEMYYFKRPITPVKVSASEIAALQGQPEMDAIKMEPDMLGLMEDSLDGGPPSVGSDMVATASPAPHQQHLHLSGGTPISVKKKDKERKSKLVTGYILYSSEVRKDRAQNNQDLSFGDISRLVGNEWRSLPASDKQGWEEKAARCNEEHAARFAEENGCPSPAPPAHTFFTAEPLPNQVSERRFVGLRNVSSHFFFRYLSVAGTIVTGNSRIRWIVLIIALPKVRVMCKPISPHYKVMKLNLIVCGVDAFVSRKMHHHFRI